MNIFCIEEFKTEFEKLIKKKSYRDIEEQLINYFFDKTVEELKSGTRLNNSDDAPYIKKRLKGRGGYRCYYLLIIRDERLYLMFIHPKTGATGAENITDESKASLYKKVLECIQDNDLYKLSLNDDGDKIEFIKI